AVIADFVKDGAQLAVLGDGDKKYVDTLTALQARFPRQVGLHIGYSEPLAHQIEAGADIFLMPSEYEPCGLNQLYSLRYGTIPVVRATGGLADTVIDDETGFTFGPFAAEPFAAALRRCLAVFRAEP